MLADHGRCSGTSDHHIQDDLFAASGYANVFGALVDHRFRCRCCILILLHNLFLYYVRDSVVKDLWQPGSTRAPAVGRLQGCNRVSFTRKCDCHNNRDLVDTTSEETGLNQRLVREILSAAGSERHVYRNNMRGNTQ